MPHATRARDTDNTSIWLAAFDKIHLVCLLLGLRRSNGNSSTAKAAAAPSKLLLSLLIPLLLYIVHFLSPSIPLCFSSRLSCHALCHCHLASFSLRHFAPSVVVFDNIKVERRLPLATYHAALSQPSRAQLNRGKSAQAEQLDWAANKCHLRP